MDEKTQSIIAILGHPIAGNPSQFALERALEAVGLDWRVFSFEIAPDQLDTAVRGLEVLGVRGVRLDDQLARVAHCKSGDQGWVDCLARIPDSDELVSSSSSYDSILSFISAAHGDEKTGDVFVTESEDKLDLTNELQSHSVAWQPFPADLDQLASAAAIVIQDHPRPGASHDLDLDDWPETECETTVIGLDDGERDLTSISHKGYRVITKQALWVDVLSRCFFKWTEKDAPTDILNDAIEEYLSV